MMLIRLGLGLSVAFVGLAACLNFGECSVDEDCTGGDVCSAGVCVECEADGDCADGETCSDNECAAAAQNGPPTDGAPIDDGTGSIQLALCCFAADGVPQAFECENDELARTCEGEGPAAVGCTQNAERDAECGAT